MHRSVAILAFGVAMLGLAACTGSPSGANFVPQQSAMDQGVPLLGHSSLSGGEGRQVKDQGVPLLSRSSQLSPGGGRQVKDQGVPLL
jgi:uncharacterized lipoprotein YajG